MYVSPPFYFCHLIYYPLLHLLSVSLFLWQIAPRICLGALSPTAVPPVVIHFYPYLGQSSNLCYTVVPIMWLNNNNSRRVRGAQAGHQGLFIFFQTKQQKQHNIYIIKQKKSLETIIFKGNIHIYIYINTSTLYYIHIHFYIYIYIYIFHNPSCL